MEIEPTTCYVYNRMLVLLSHDWPHLITIINYMIYINNIPFAGGVLQERSSYHAVCAGSRSPFRALQFYWRGYKCEYK